MVTSSQCKSKARELVAYEIMTDVLPGWTVTPTSDLMTIGEGDYARQDLAIERNGTAYWAELKTRDCTADRFLVDGYMVSKSKIDKLAATGEHAYLAAIFHKSNAIYVWDVNDDRSGWRTEIMETEKNNFSNEKKTDEVYILPFRNAKKLEHNMNWYTDRFTECWRSYAILNRAEHADKDILDYRLKNNRIKTR